jgi:hypothetical protein
MLPYKPIKNGLATVREYGLSESPDKHTPYLWIEFVFDNEKATDGEELSIKYFGYLTDKNMPYVLGVLHALRWTGKSIMDLDNPIHDAIHGRKAYLTVDMEEYKGQFKPKVKFVNETEFAGPKPLADQEKKKLAARFDGQIARFQAENPLPIFEEIPKDIDEDMQF